jgi:type II secretory pathway component PulF
LPCGSGKGLKALLATSQMCLKAEGKVRKTKSFQIHPLTFQTLCVTIAFLQLTFVFLPVTIAFLRDVFAFLPIVYVFLPDDIAFLPITFLFLIVAIVLLHVTINLLRSKINSLSTRHTSGCKSSPCFTSWSRSNITMVYTLLV